MERLSSSLEPEIMSDGQDQAMKIHADLTLPLTVTGWPFYVSVASLGVVVLWGLFAWGYQIKRGMGVAGINSPVFWGVYIATFVFYVGISHAGTLISAILRLTHASWRRPVTRCAEAITVFALMVGGLFPLIHLGRVWKFYWIIPYPNERGLWPNFHSPLVWDFMAIFTYLIGSLAYLYLPLLPDIALLRDSVRGWRRKLYSVLALGWSGTPVQWHRLEKAVSVMAVIIVPIAVSVHTVVSWDFAMSLNPMWHSTIFGPYFVVGAIFSGIASLIIAMVILRKVLHLEAYLRPVHFNNLGLLLLTMALLWFYFTFSEYLTTWYGSLPDEMASFEFRVTGPLAPLFWGMILLNFVIPVPLLAFRKTRTIMGCFLASVLILIGMWLERFLIVVGTLSRPRLEFAWGSYTPTWVEISVIVGTVAYFILLYVLFCKLFPIVSIWEIKEPEPHSVDILQPSRFADSFLHEIGEEKAEVVALFETLPDTRRAVRLLRDAGVSPEKVTVFSSEPLDEGEFVTEERRKTRLAGWACLGAVLGLTAGYLLTSVTARLMNLSTGGQPVASLWAFGIVIFEFTALGAVAGTVIALLWEADLFPFKERLYDDESAADLARCASVVRVDSEGREEMAKVRWVMQEAEAKKINTNW